jgi:hypothetical protein
MSHPKIGQVNAGVRQIIDGNKIQDGCRRNMLEKYNIINLVAFELVH